MQKLIRRLLRLESLTAPEEFPSEAESGSNFLDAQYVGLTDAKLSGWYLTESNELFRGIYISESDVVVDVGCGEGGSISYCGNLGAHIIGIDKDEDALRRAIECTRDSKARVKEFHIAQAEHLPLPDGFATRVLCTEVLEHVEDPSVVLAELFRIGMPGSLYLITVPDYLAEKMQQHVAPICYFQHPNHIRIIDREEFKCLVENAGLKIISHTNYGFFWSIWWALFWGCETNTDNQNGSALNHWTQAWSKLLETSKGRQLQEKLNAFMPKSQVIVALKSE